MDPNENQPNGPQSPVSGQDGQPPMPLPASSTTPDWQQGLGGQAPQQTAPRAVVPSGPSQPPASMPGGMPAGQRGSWPNPGVPAVMPPITGGDMPNMGMNSAPRFKKNSQLFIVIGVVVAVLTIVVATYFLFLKGDGSATDAANKSDAIAGATSMSTLNHVMLNVPASITGYTSRNTGVDTIKDFISDDGNCEFIAGTVTAAQLPGADLNAIVNPQIKQLKDGGATVKGPSAGAALALKQQGGSKKYSMPTLNFEFSQGKKHAVVHYSAVILKSSDRAVINRTCVNKDGAVDAAKMTALDEVAKSLTATIKQ